MFDTRFTPKTTDSDEAALCHAVSPRTLTSNGNLIRGFLLSRQVMECSDRTLGDYESRLGQFQRCLGDVPLTTVTRQYVEAYLLWLKEHGRVSWTLRTNYRVLKAFYNWMVEEEFIGVSPLLRIKPPRVPKLGKPFISNEQRDMLLYCCPPSTFRGARATAMLWLLWSTGIRAAELAGLMLVDLDWERERIRVFGKGRRERYVEFTKEARRAIWRYLMHRNDDLPQLWVSVSRTPLEPFGVRDAVYRVYRQAGLCMKDMCHVFRRSWARRKINEGMAQKHIMLVGGWEDPKTLDGYVNAMTSEEALRAMSKANSV